MALGGAWKWRLDRRADAEVRLSGEDGASYRSGRGEAQHDSTFHGFAAAGLKMEREKALGIRFSWWHNCNGFEVVSPSPGRPARSLTRDAVA